MTESEQQIVPGISISAAGQATIEPALSDVLFDLALALEEETRLPVDVQHVLAALVLAARNGQLDSDRKLVADDPTLTSLLVPHVHAVFSQYDGKVGSED